MTALLRACHPLPSAAVTAFAVALAASVGNGVGTCVLVAVAVLAGQLSVGWSNDRIDASRDRAVGRTDKPLATGEVSLAAADRAIVAALVVTVPASLALGWRAGSVHLLAVGCGWVYNARAKATWFSWLPYAVAFGAAPAVAAFALPHHPAPAWWAVTAGALVGATAHVTNALPDLRDDRRTGIVGFPHRIGARPALFVGTGALVAGSAVLVLGPRGNPSALRWAGLAVVAAWAVLGCAAAWRRPQAGWLFYGTLAVVALDLALLMLGPSFAT